MREPKEYLEKAKAIFLHVGAQLEAAESEALINELTATQPEKEEQFEAQDRQILTATRKLKSLLKVSQSISAILDLEALLEQILEAAVAVIGAERGYLFLQQDGQLRLKIAKGIEKEELNTDGFAFSKSVIEKVAGNGEPILTTDAQTDPQLQLHESVLLYGLRSILCVPLKLHGGLLGLLYLDNRLLANVFSEEDFELLTAFAAQAAIAIDNASAYTQLQELTNTLEQRVQQRTEELQAANVKLQELNQIKSTFVSVVSHELRTPMTSIRVYAENMLDGLIGSLTDEQSRYLKRILFNVDRLTRLSTDLLDLSKIESGKVELRLERLSLDEVLSDIVEGFRHSLKENDIALDVSSADEAVTVHADRDKLAQIFTNLFSNAIKFTPAGGKIQILTKVQSDGYLHIRISDTGCGIAPEELPKVFEKFFRGESTPSGIRGAGLGLAIVKNLVELHGGMVGVESTVGRGSTFFFTVPTSRTSVPTLS